MPFGSLTLNRLSPTRPRRSGRSRARDGPGLVGVGRDALGRDLPAGGLERLVRRGGIDQAGLRWLPRRRWFPRSFPVLPSLFYRLHFVPEELMAIIFGLRIATSSSAPARRAQAARV